jgi:hypothetical protein
LEVGEFDGSVFHTTLIMLKVRPLSTPVLFILQLSFWGDGAHTSGLPKACLQTK